MVGQEICTFAPARATPNAGFGAGSAFGPAAKSALMSSSSCLAALAPKPLTNVGAKVMGAVMVTGALVRASESIMPARAAARHDGGRARERRAWSLGMDMSRFGAITS